ncbi:hypothetical protein OUZ56_013842 [Daphnia magna]|uniref:Uncharacterized protein n=1 Tax=Daphnia magna TaxID=35525 RepID=A0ABQ9Z7T3_9CRUS|nr:hypothetical protein OUZ56_013842 [Daphnia magna]
MCVSLILTSPRVKWKVAFRALQDAILNKNNSNEERGYIYNGTDNTLTTRHKDGIPWRLSANGHKEKKNRRWCAPGAGTSATTRNPRNPWIAFFAGSFSVLLAANTVSDCDFNICGRA